MKTNPGSTPSPIIHSSLANFRSRPCGKSGFQGGPGCSGELDYSVEYDAMQPRFSRQLVVCLGEDKKSPGSESSRGFRGGGYLLFHFRSIIGVAGFNFSVRNGKRWNPRAMATLVFLFGVRGLVLCPACGAVWLEERVWKRNRDVNATNLACSVSAAAVQQVSVTASGCRPGPAANRTLLGGLRPGKGLGD